MTGTGPLAWLRVVDLTDLRGAMCARILADLGADVVRVEQRSGAPDDASLADAYRNANKQRVDLDLGDDRGRARLDDLLDEADVLVENLACRCARRPRPHTRRDRREPPAPRARRPRRPRA